MTKTVLQLGLLLSCPLVAMCDTTTEAELAGAQASLTQTKLPPAEAHIRSGIILLNELNTCLAGIDSEEKADHSVAKILELQMQLTKWGQGFNAIPTEDADIIKQYETYYLPIIEQLNNSLKVQSRRLNAAQYYKSKNLGAVLVNFVDALK